MTVTEHPRLLARIAGVFYVVIIVFALFAYLYVRGQLIIPSNMAQTATNVVAHEQLYRLGFSAAVVVVICAYCAENFMLFLALPGIPYIGWIHLVAEVSLALWLLLVGLNEGEWRAQALEHG
jgi:hypothetical protein